MKDTKKQYMKRVRALFPVYGIPERRFLKGLENSLEEYLLEHPAASLSDFEDRFGAPQDVVNEYITGSDVNYLYKRLNIAKYIRLACIVMLALAILLFAVEYYHDYCALQEFRDSLITYEESIIEDLPNE